MSNDAATEEDAKSTTLVQQLLVKGDVVSTVKKQKIHFWHKWAWKPETAEEDQLNYNEIKEGAVSIREVLREFDLKIIGKKLLFSDIRPDNDSVKRWINEIMLAYPGFNNNIVEDLLNTFRTSLGTRSREKYAYIVGLLLLDDTLLLLHCKKDKSLAQWDEMIHPANIILSRKNVLRTAIIRNEDGKLTFSAFEQSRSWSKGHAQFWGIEPDDVNWDSLGHIVLFVELTTFNYPLQLPIEADELKELIDNEKITSTGDIRIGREDGKVTRVQIFKKMQDWDEFYDFFITESDKLQEYGKKFDGLVPSSSHHSVSAFDPSLIDFYQYEEDLEKVIEITTEGEKIVCRKRHPRYNICFFTKEYPRIRPRFQLVKRIYDAIFYGHTLEIWHAGEDSSRDYISIGTLKIYNHLNIKYDFIVFSRSLLDIIQDHSSSKKTRSLLEYYYCSLWNKYLKNRHVGSIFEFIIKDILISDLKFHFSSNGLMDKEDTLEFKSRDDVNSKPKDFIEITLLPTIRKYIKESPPSRLCILYGIEDTGVILPIPQRRLKSDTVSFIEKEVNKELKKDSLSTIIQTIPFNDDVILAVFMIPDLEKIAAKNSEFSQLISVKQES